MTEVTDETLDRTAERLKTARTEYLGALFNLEPYVEERAANGDELARLLVAEVQRARERMVTENMSAAEMMN